MLARQAMKSPGVGTACRLVALSAGWAWGDRPGGAGVTATLQLSDERAAALLHQDSATAARELHPLGYPVTAFALVQIPSEEELATEELARLDAVLGRAPRRDTARQAEPPAANPLQQALSGLMRQMQSEAGLTRVVFAMLAPDRGRLQARLAIGGAPEDALRRLNLILDQGQLFRMLLTKTQSIWVHPGNAGKYLPHLPRHWVPGLQETGLFAMSIVIAERPLGVIYGDGPALDETGYRQFRALCQVAAERLAGDRRAA